MNTNNMIGGKSMRDKVKEEIKHIPRGNAAQNELRMYYWPMRMNSLGKKATGPKKTKGQILIDAVNAVKKNYPDFEPDYDKHFFNE